MQDWLVEYYLWLKSFHIMMSISWMAGLFYLPRLFVYHTRAKVDAEDYDRFVIMEQKLLSMIMLPAAIITWLSGMLIAWGMDYWLNFWFLAKMAFAIPMSLVHVQDCFWARAFAQGRNRHSERFFRFWNEAPTLLMIAIVILVVVKPS